MFLPELAVFDVDGTIVSGDLQPLFLKYARRHGAIGIGDFILVGLYTTFYKLGLLSGENAMSRCYRFIKGKTPAEINLIAGGFHREVGESKIFPGMASVVAEHRSRGAKIIFISMVPKVILAPLARFLNADAFFGTSLEIDGGYYTGEIGPVLVGDRKAEVLADYLKENPHGAVYVYADSASDLALLKEADHPVAINPDPVLRREAGVNGWRIVEFNLKGSAI